MAKSGASFGCSQNGRPFGGRLLIFAISASHNSRIAPFENSEQRTWFILLKLNMRAASHHSYSAFLTAL